MSHSDRYKNLDHNNEQDKSYFCLLWLQRHTTTIMFEQHIHMLGITKNINLECKLLGMDIAP